MIAFLRRLFREADAPAQKTEEEKLQLRVTESAALRMGTTRIPAKAYAMPTVAPGVIPRAEKMAMDSTLDEVYEYARHGAFAEGIGFMGFPYLSELAQRAEYRRPAEILSKEMTRKWIKIQASGEEDKTDTIKAIEAEFKRLKVQDTFQKAIEQDGFFGRSQIFLDTGKSAQDELKTPLIESVAKIGKSGIKALRLVESIWTYPARYNSTDPLSDTYFKPESWYVQGKEIHSSRLLMFIARPVPDILKPAYAFSGLSLSQMAKPYVDNWLRTRQSVSDLIHSFSVMGLKTNMSQVLNGGAAEDLYNRAELFNRGRDNKSLMLLDKDTEELFNVSVPLGSLDKLQAQAQEHMAAVTGIPLVKLLGITPSGLNASSEGELESFYAWIESQQESLLSPQIERLMNIVQLALFGEIDPEIGFKWEPLWTESSLDQANERKIDADADAVLINAGVISPEESRQRIASTEDSPYSALDMNDIPEAPEDDELQEMAGAEESAAARAE